MKFKNLRMFQRGTWADLLLAEVVGTEETVMIKRLRSSRGHVRHAGSSSAS